jgi:hypothetical protein
MYPWGRGKTKRVRKRAVLLRAVVEGLRCLRFTRRIAVQGDIVEKAVDLLHEREQFIRILFGRILSAEFFPPFGAFVWHGTSPELSITRDE